MAATYKALVLESAAGATPVLKDLPLVSPGRDANRKSTTAISCWTALMAVGGLLLAFSSGCSSSTPAGDHGSGGAGPSPDGGGPDAAVPTFATVAELVALDPMKGALSEGMAIRERKAYLGYASTGEIVQVDLATAAIAAYSSVPKPVAGMGFVTGLEFRGADLYAALVSFNPRRPERSSASRRPARSASG